MLVHVLHHEVSISPSPLSGGCFGTLDVRKGAASVTLNDPKRGTATAAAVVTVVGMDTP